MLLRELLRSRRSRCGSDVPIEFLRELRLPLAEDVFEQFVADHGTKEEFQALENDLNAIENARRSLGDRISALSEAKEAELNHLHAQVHTLQAAVPPPQPRKVVVDDTVPAKKPVPKKKAVPKPPAAGAQPATPPAAAPAPK